MLWRAGRSCPIFAPLEIAPPHLSARPALVEGAETLACVSAIFEGHLGAVTASAGALGVEEGAGERVTGTKMITVSEASRPEGSEVTVEIPLGMTVRAVLEGVWGADTGSIKAVQFGGPTGAFLAGDALDMPITYDELEAAGHTMGSGGMKVVREPACAVEMARDAARYLHEQSCAQCVFCREGTYQLADLLTDLVEFRAGDAEMELLLELAEAMKTAGICAVGRRASAPVLTAIELFGDDFALHVREKRCPVGA